MGTLKYTIGSAMASVTLFLAPAATVAASETNVSDSYNNTSTNTSTETNTNTETNNGIEQDADDHGKNFAVLGNCSGIFFNEISQSQYTDLVNGSNERGYEWFGEWLNGHLPQPNNDSNSQSSSSSQSATGISFSPNCSVTNVQQAAAQVVAAAQVSAPKGGVGAGVGGAVGSSLTAILGVAGSIGSLGYGLRRLGN